MEVVISVGVLAVVVPVVLAMIIAGGESSRIAGDETRAALIARSVVEEIRAARDGGGLVLKDPLAWPKFPAGAERLVLAVDADGKIVTELGAEEYESGERDGELRYLVSAKGEWHRPDGLPDSEVLSRVEVSVETPPAAKAEDRRKFVFVQLLHRDD
jgi:hypothetical protein